MAAQFASYPQLTIEERKHLVANSPICQQNKETDQNSNTPKPNYPEQFL